MPRACSNVRSFLAGQPDARHPYTGARKLAVLLHRLWVTGEVYEPLRAPALPAR